MFLITKFSIAIVIAIVIVFIIFTTIFVCLITITPVYFLGPFMYRTLAVLTGTLISEPGLKTLVSFDNIRFETAPAISD